MKPASARANSNVRLWLTALAVMVLCSIPFFQSYSIRNRPLGEDEIYWIGQAYYYHLAIEQRDWSNPDWQLLPARENPVIGKFVIGLGLRFDGLTVKTPDWLGIFYIIAKDRPNAWGTEHDHAERQAVLDRMEPGKRELAMTEGRFEYPPEYALAARAIMMFFGMVSVGLVFALTALYTKPATAFIAAVLFSFHPAVVEAFTEVGVDIIAIAFSLLSVVHFVLIERRVWQNFKRPVLGRALISVAGALSVAFAIGSKMNALIILVLGTALCAIFAVASLRSRSAGARESALVMAVVPLGAVTVFVLTNPVNYPNPLRGVWSVFADQQRSLEVQKTIPALRHPLQSAGERVHALAELTAFHPAMFALVIAAFLAIVARRKTGTARLIIAWWWLIAVLMVTAWLPFARLRYVLPVIPASVILLAMAGEELAVGIKRKLSKARKNDG